MPLARGEHLDLVAHSESWYPRYHYGWSELRSIQDGRFKLIRAPRPELYDLATDPGEERDRSTEYARAARRVWPRARRVRVAHRESRRAARGREPIDAETEERLAALGYVVGQRQI